MTNKARHFVDGELYFVDREWDYLFRYAWMKWVRADRSITTDRAVQVAGVAIMARSKREQKENLSDE